MQEPIPIDLPTQRVTVVDVDISFGQLVNLIMKGSLALLFCWFFLGVLGFVLFLVIGYITSGA